VVGPKIKREAALYAKDKFVVSATRVCKVLGLARSSFDYASYPRDNSHVEDALKKLVSENKRLGHPRIHLLLSREKGMRVNHKKSSVEAFVK